MYPKLRTKTFGHRSFSFAALTQPSELLILHTDSILKFRSALRTLLGNSMHDTLNFC